jgi:hypothetical protein
MAHKVEIQNLLNASRSIDPTIRQLRNNFQEVVTKLDILHSFIETACSDCAEDNDIVIKRTAFADRIAAVNAALTTAKEAASGGSYLALEDYWAENIIDTTGLTNPTSSVVESTPDPEPELTPDPESVTDANTDTDTVPASGA